MSAEPRTERHAALTLLDEREGHHQVDTFRRVLQGNAFEPHRPQRFAATRRVLRDLVEFLAQPSPFRGR
ncbi:MAG: hypothetical protein RJA98_3830 [Pseudomonadota bacterium]|jgi:hypothetical protein